MKLKNLILGIVCLVLMTSIASASTVDKYPSFYGNDLYFNDSLHYRIGGDIENRYDIDVSYSDPNNYVPTGQHIQGIAMGENEEYLYASFTQKIVKYTYPDLDFVDEIEVAGWHFGDFVIKDNKIYNPHARNGAWNLVNGDSNITIINTTDLSIINSFSISDDIDYSIGAMTYNPRTDRFYIGPATPSTHVGIGQVYVYKETADNFLEYEKSIEFCDEIPGYGIENIVYNNYTDTYLIGTYYDGNANYSHCRGEFNKNFEQIDDSGTPISTYGFDVFGDNEFVRSRYISSGTIMGYYSGTFDTGMTYNGDDYNIDTNGATLIATVTLDDTPAHVYNYYSYIFRKTDDTLGLYFGGAGYDLTSKLSTAEGTTPRPVAHSASFNDYTEQNIAVRYDKDGTGNYSIFKNGVEDATVQRDGTNINGNDIMHVAFGIYGKFFTGKLKDVFIYGTALNDSEMLQVANYNNNISKIPKKEDLDFFNPGVGGSEKLMLDLSGQHNHGLIFNYNNDAWGDYYEGENTYLEGKEFMTMDVESGSKFIDETQIIVPYDIFGENPLSDEYDDNRIMLTSNINYYTLDNKNMDIFNINTKDVYYDNKENDELSVYVEGYNGNQMDFCSLYYNDILISQENIVNNTATFIFDIDSVQDEDSLVYNMYCEDITGNNETKSFSVVIENYDKAMAVSDGVSNIKSVTYVAFGLLAVAIIAIVAMLMIQMMNGGFNSGALISVAIMAIGLAIVLFVGYIIISAVARGLIG